MSGSITFGSILSKRVLEWQVILVGCKTKGINELEVSEKKPKPGHGKIFFVTISFSLYVLIMSGTCFRVNPCSIAA